MRFGVETTVLLATGALLVGACSGGAGSTSDDPPAAPPAPEQTEPETPQEVDQAPAEGRTGAEPVGDDSAPVPDAQEGRRGGAGIITSVAGVVLQGDAGPATAARLSFPAGVTLDGAGNLFIADTRNHRVRRVDAATGVITTVAGTGEFGFGGDGGPATAARLWSPEDLALDGAGNLFFAEPRKHRVRRVDAATGVITTVAGTGEQGGSGDRDSATAALLGVPDSVALDGAGNLFIADHNNHRVRRVDAVTGVITTVAGTGPGAGPFESDSECCFGGDGGPATEASFIYPSGVAVDEAGNLFIADYLNDRVRRVDAATGVITTVAGTGAVGIGAGGFGGDGGPATAAQLDGPSSVALDGAGHLFIADWGNQRVRRVDAATGIITTVAGTGERGFGGDGGPATAAQLDGPSGVALDGAGNLFIADQGARRIRRVAGIAVPVTNWPGIGPGR